MYYELHGNGTIPLVLIHGGGSTIETTFGHILPMLAEQHKIIAVELQAHGRTSDRDTPESFEQDADDVAALLKFLRIEKANILGFSNGGTTTLQIAIRHAELVNKIIVVSGATKRKGFIDGFFESMPNATLENMPMPLQEAFLKVALNKNGLQTMFEKDRDRMVHFKDMHDDDLRTIYAPALFMVADRDVVTCEHTIELSRTLPNAKLVVLPGVHGAFLGEICTEEKGRWPEITTAIIGEFLNQ